MPLLAGGYLGDASLNNVQDASSNNIGESSIYVAVTSGNILYDAGKPEPPGWGDLVDLFAEAILVAQIKETVDDIWGYTYDLYQNYSINDQQGLHALAANAANINNAANNSAANVQTILAAIEAIEPGEGMTQEEHDQLMGLANADPDVIALAVWNMTYPTMNLMGEEDDVQMNWVVGLLHDYLTFQAGYVGFPVLDKMHFNGIAKSIFTLDNFAGYWTNLASTPLPNLDLSLVESGDTVWSYLTREYDAYSWQRTGPGTWPQGNRIYLQVGENAAYYVCTLTDADIRNWWPPESDPPPTVNVTADFPPVWPGLAGVTLGDSVALVDQLNLQGTFDGVIVTVTTPPTKTGRRQIGGATYDYGVGEMAFENDRGDLEPWQYLGFRNAVFTPKTMKQASGARFRVLAGAEGTVIPWTRS